MIEDEHGTRSTRTATVARRPRRGRRAGVVVVAAIALAATTVMPAGAVRYSGGMSSQSFCVQNPSVNSTWLSAINAGRNAWNNHASFPGTISLYSGCTSVLQVGSYGSTWMGLYTPLITGSQYRIRLDSANLNSHISANGYAFANVVRSTTAHEFGHALRLGDHDNLPTRLMSGSRNRNSVISPTTAEVNESNGYY